MLLCGEIMKNFVGPQKISLKIWISQWQKSIEFISYNGYQMGSIVWRNILVLVLKEHLIGLAPSVK